MSEPRSNSDATDAAILTWSGRLLTAADLHGLSPKIREVVVAPGTIITPSARDILKGLRVRFSPAGSVKAEAKGAWAVAMQGDYPQALAAFRSVDANLRRLPNCGPESPLVWAIRTAGYLVRGEVAGIVVFSGMPAVVTCVANKLPGVRGAVGSTAADTKQLLATLAMNWLAIGVPGPTYFEMRQMIHACRSSTMTCPADVRLVTAELDRVRGN